MKKYPSITATAQGIITYDKNGKQIIQRYDNTYQKKSDFKPKHILETSENLEKIHLNMIQRQMFRRLMYGLKEYTPEQMASMSPTAITNIVEDYKKAKRALHVLKAKRHYQAETKLLNAIFPDMEIGTKDFDWYLDVSKHITLRSLGISTKEVIDEFITRRLLPKNFYTITPENVSMP
jgi:esterase/lipase